jgi:hypothetical protein
VSRGSITLGDVAEHTTVLAVACSRCERVGRYNLHILMARHGEGFGIPNLLRLLSKDCVKRASVSAYDLCGVHCPEFPLVLSGQGGLIRRPPGRATNQNALAVPADGRRHRAQSRRGDV